MLLAVAVAAADPLLDPLGVPGQVVVDHEGAELEIHALGRRLGGDEDVGAVAEVLDQGGAEVDGLVPGDDRLAGVPLDPVLVDGARSGRRR